MIIGIGTDIIEIGRVEKAISRRAGLLLKIFTEAERQYCFSRKNPWPSLAARFAAKEAVMKALGVGLSQCGFNEIEIKRNSQGKPEIFLAGKALAMAQKQGINYWHLSLSHNKNHGLAFALAEKRMDLQK
ncbi:MAG: holo-ACP synthase [Bacillota bacterium]